MPEPSSHIPAPPPDADPGWLRLDAPLPPPRLPAGADPLQPRSLGEILDHAFSLYRRHFLLFAGLAALSGAVHLLGQILILAINHGTLLPRARLGISFGSVLALCAFALAGAVTASASVWVMARLQTGTEANGEAAFSITTSLQATRKLWPRVILLAVWQGLCIAGPIFVAVLPGAILTGIFRADAMHAALAAGLILLGALAGIPLGLWLYLRYSLAIPVCVLEAASWRHSLSRSRLLTHGAKWQILVLGLILWALYMVVSALQIPFTFLILRAPAAAHTLSQAAILFLSLLGHVLIAPVASIGLTLLYFDRRVRLEGLDLLVRMGAQPGAPLPAWTSTEPAPPRPGAFAPDFTIAAPLPGTADDDR